MDGSFAGNVTNDDKDKSVIRGGEFNSTISDSFLERAIVTHLSENDSDELKSPARNGAAEHQGRNIFRNDEVCQDDRNNLDEKKEEKVGHENDRNVPNNNTVDPKICPLKLSNICKKMNFLLYQKIIL